MRPVGKQSRILVGVLAALVVLAAACAPAAPPAPEPAPKPAQPAAAPEAKPAPKPAAPAPAPEAKPAPDFDEQAVADFYRGKTVTLIAPTSAGSSIDLIARMVARRIGGYIPGNPTVIVELMPGAGGALAANHVYNVAPKDGTVVITPQEGLVLQQALGASGLQFDARQWNWLGSTLQTNGSCIVRTGAAAEDIHAAIAGTELVMGLTQPGGTTYDIGATLKHALGANFRLVPGYVSSPELLLAMEREEIDAWCVSVPGMLATAGQALESGEAKFLIVMGSEPVDVTPFTQGVPPAETLAQTEEDRALLRVVNTPQRMNKPWTMAPGVPDERVAAMRSALWQVFEDPAFIEEMARADQDLDPNTPEGVAAVVDELFNTPEAVIEQLKEILRP